MATRDTPGTRTFRWFLASELLYFLGTTGVLVSPSADVATGFYYVASAGGVAVGSAWVLFVVEYAGYWDRMRWWTHALIWGQPALYVVALLTNPWHGTVIGTETASYGFLTLVAPTYYPIAQFEIIYILVLVLSSFALLVHLFDRTRTVHRKQTGAILVGALLPTAAYSLFWTEFTPHPALDLTPVAFVLQAIVVGWALYRYDFLEVSPIATEFYIQQMADPLLVLDERDRLIDYNDSATAALGIDDPGHRPHVRSVSPELNAALSQDWGSLELATADGPATFDLTETVIRDRHDRIRGAMIVLRDVTELEEQRAELQRKNAQLEQFTSVVSHDLRNPLNVARGFAELARDEDDPAALERSIDAMADMEDLIEDLLTLAREGRTVDEVELVSVLDVVQAAWAEAPTEGARLELDDDADFECYADPERFRELLGNLFRNAVEHGTGSDADHASAGPDQQASAGSDAEQASTGPDPEHAQAGSDASPETTSGHTAAGGSGRSGASDGADGADATQSDADVLTVTVGRCGDDPGFFVEDDGVGISDTAAESVFEAGFTTASDGTGFGLSIVSSIANAHGWTVSLAESEAGGARFEFTGVSTPG